MAVASAGPYANLHLVPDRQPRRHPTAHTVFTDRMPFLPPNEQHHSTEGGRDPVGSDVKFHKKICSRENVTESLAETVTKKIMESR